MATSKRMSATERLAARSHVVAATGCIVWDGFKNADGYGKLAYLGEARAAHRVAYMVGVGDIPRGMFVCHKCDNPSCINTEHLFLGTQSDNMRDMANKSRRKNIGMGTANGRSKLTEAQANSIRVDRRAGSQIAKEYGISVTTANYIRNGKLWSFLSVSHG